MKQQIIQTIELVKERTPLVHNITNYVVMNNTANALLAFGASPVMAHALQEVEDIVTISSSLVINMGTLSKKWVKSMLAAAKKAKLSNTPFVFDPVGVGASAYRNEVAASIVEQASPNVIRANASELIALTGLGKGTKGVDSTDSSESALEAAKTLSARHHCTVVISGPTDYIVTGEKVTAVENGSTLMAKVTGMGCTATALVGACLGVCADTHTAAVAAMSAMGVAGELTAAQVKGPGSFQVQFLDALYQLDAATLEANLKLA